MSLDRRLVSKGKAEPFQALIDQAKYHHLLAQQHAAQLADQNWTPEQTAELGAEIAALETDKNRQLDERSSAKASTRHEGVAITEAKNLINKVRNVARLVVRKHGGADVTLDEFNSGGPLSRIAARIDAYLGRLRVPVAKLDAAFAPYFNQQVLSQLIDEARKKLSEANALQEVDIAALPEDTAVLYERKGRLLEHIEDINALAKNAFSDAPETRAKFNKDILRRGRKSRAVAEPAAPATPEALIEPTEPGAPSAE